MVVENENGVGRPKQKPRISPASPMNSPQGGGFAAPTYLENTSNGAPSFSPPTEGDGDKRTSADQPLGGGTPFGGGVMPLQPQSTDVQRGAGGSQSAPQAPAIAPPAMPQAAPVPPSQPAPVTAGPGPKMITESVENMAPVAPPPAARPQPLEIPGISGGMRQMPVLKRDVSIPENERGGSGSSNSPFGDLGRLIEEAYRKPSRYDNEEAKKFYDYAKGDLQHERDMSLSELDTNAARRGVFHSSIPVTGSDAVGIGERYNRGLGDLATNIEREMATTQAGDRSSAFGDAFKFLDGANRSDQTDLMIAQLAAQLGGNGGIDIGDVLQSYGPMPTPDFGDGMDWSALGGLFADNKQKDHAPIGVSPASGNKPVYNDMPGAQAKKPRISRKI